MKYEYRFKTNGIWGSWSAIPHPSDDKAAQLLADYPEVDMVTEHCYGSTTQIRRVTEK